MRGGIVFIRAEKNWYNISEADRLVHDIVTEGMKKFYKAFNKISIDLEKDFL